MNYIYDIVLNFQKVYCEFYEWKRSDECLTIRRAPIYRVSTDDFQVLKNNDVVVSDEFMEMLKKDLGNVKKNICIVSEGSMGLGLLLDNDGKVIKRSSMVYDEEDEVSSYAMEFDEINISYKKNKKYNRNYELRFCRERRKFLYNYLKNIKDDMVWKYLYYECFMDDIDDISKIKKSLLDIANQGYGKLNDKLYDSILVFSKIKN